MRVAVKDLAGAQLDNWVGMAANGASILPPWMLGRQISDCVNGVRFGKEKRYFMPSANWQQAGPIIEGERIAIVPAADCTKWAAEHTDEEGSRILQFADTPLEAAMRCYVASKFGDYVDLPD